MGLFETMRAIFWMFLLAIDTFGAFAQDSTRLIPTDSTGAGSLAVVVKDSTGVSPDTIGL
jgi:hypothetical protein